MSRFDDVSYDRGNGTPYLSIHTTGARFNKAAVKRFIGGAESVVFKYDEDRDELGLFFGEEGKQSRSLSGADSGRTVSIRGTLTSGEIGLDFCGFTGNVRLEIKHDGLEGVPYVSLAPLREALEQPHDVSGEGDELKVTESWGSAPKQDKSVADGGTTIEPQAADHSGNPDVDQMVAQSEPRTSPESASEDAPSGLSNEKRILALIEENGGRMRQSEIHGGIGRSKGHVSRLLREMDERGEVEKIRLGRSNIITLPDDDPSGDSSDVDEEEERGDADGVDEDTEEEADADADSIELDLTQVDMTHVRELLPSNAGVMDVVEHVRSSQSSFGVARSLGVPREQAELLLEEIGLDELVTMRGESA